MRPGYVSIQYNGGLLTTCGLTHTGDAETHNITGEHRNLHGHFTRLGAYQIGIERSWRDEKYFLQLTCFISLSTLFGEQLRVKRMYQVTLGEPVITLTDCVENLYDVPTSLMLLYHFNLGYPLVRD